MNHPYALSLFLVDGITNGLKILEKPNWSGRGLSCSKSVLFQKHRKRSELQTPGIYLLTGPTEDGLKVKRLYVGEGERVMTRLESHLQEKEWWNEVIVFTASDHSLNKAFIKYLEARLVKLARNSQRYSPDNVNSPEAPRMSERENAICEGFLREMLLCLPLFGVNLDAASSHEQSKNDHLYIRAKGIEACGIETPDGFVVFSGSHITRDETGSAPASIRRWRDTLQEDGTVQDDGNGSRKFTKDHLFGSPSTAAAVVLGASSNGREVWRNKSGETLKSIQLRKYSLEAAESSV